MHNELLKRDRRLCERLRKRPLYSLYNPEAPSSSGDAGLVFSVVERHQQAAGGDASTTPAPSALLTSRLVSKRRFGLGLRKSVREGLDEATRQQLFDQNYEAVGAGASSKGGGGGGGDDGGGDAERGSKALNAALSLLEQLGVANAVEFGELRGLG